MNQTEAQYGIVLAARQGAGHIREYHYQALTLVLGDDCRYTADFMVVTSTWEVELHEVKGFMREDALAKLKVAARMYPFRILLVRKAKGGAGTPLGSWEIEEVQS